MKNSKSIIALLIAVLMVVACFAACKKDQPKPNDEPEKTEEVAPTEEATAEPTAEPTEEPTPEPTAAPVNDPSAIIGTWECSINLADVMTEGMKQDETGMAQMFENVDLSDAFVINRYTFNEDGTYVYQPDIESYKTAMKQVIDELVPVLKEYMMSMFQAVAEEGQEVTEEMVLDALEIDSWDELGEQMIGNIDEDPDQLIINGTYTFEDGRLTLEGTHTEDGESETETEIYQISVYGDELTFVSVEKAASSTYPEGMFPIVFKKVA